jgi:hypothetical protein
LVAVALFGAVAVLICNANYGENVIKDSLSRLLASSCGDIFLKSGLNGSGSFSDQCSIWSIYLKDAEDFFEVVLSMVSSLDVKPKVEVEPF